VAHKRFAVGAATVILAAGLLGGLYYWSAWSAARGAAVSIVTGSPTSLGTVDQSWSEGLGHPGPRDLTVHTVGGWFRLSREQAIDFDLRNSRKPELGPTRLGVDLEFTVTGWRVIGYGTGG
jgi:hypothetical protein